MKFTSGLPETPCGKGSTLKHAGSIDLVSELSAFIEARLVTTILDVGCGDQNWIRHVDLHGAKYIGIDEEQHLDEMPMHFIKRDCPRQLGGIWFGRDWDMVLCRDVLMHCQPRKRAGILAALPLVAQRFVLVSQLPEEELPGMRLTGKVADLLVFQPSLS